MRGRSATGNFRRGWTELLTTYAGRPTPLFFARRLTQKLGGAKIYLKREDLLHTGAHKINNCLGQGLLVERMGKHRVIAETGAGSTESRLRRCARCWDLSALFTWAPRTCGGRS